jgi:hypothetical protein
MVLGMVTSDFEQGAGMCGRLDTYALWLCIRTIKTGLETNKSFKLFIKNIYHLYH